MRQNSTFFDFTHSYEPIEEETFHHDSDPPIDKRHERKELKRDIGHLLDLQSIEDVNRLMERVKAAIVPIEAALELSEEYPDPAMNREEEMDWRRRAKFALKCYQEDLARIDGYRYALQEKRKIATLRRNRTEEALIAAERKRDQASINALVQLSKNGTFVEALRRSGILSQDQWQALWAEAEKISSGRRKEFENVTYPELNARVAKLENELAQISIENPDFLWDEIEIEGE